MKPLPQTTTIDASEARERIAARLVGRETELELILAAVAAGRNLVLEGPPGTSKTTILKAITEEWGIPLFLAEGNADLSAAKLVGHHSPARVLRDDYSADTFVPGPLAQAMTEGGFLYIEELNRAPEETLNTLLMAIADRQLVVPRFGTVTAAPTFRLVASMNPLDDVGTRRLSTSVHDRLCRLSIDYQDEQTERAIVRLRSGEAAGGALGERLTADAVAATRATREHLDLRQGSSVRGAIDLQLVGRELATLRRIESPEDERYGALLLDSMLLALSGRIQLDEVAERTPEDVLREIWEQLVAATPRSTAPG